jgi:hypothetical protein
MTTRASDYTTWLTVLRNALDRLYRPADTRDFRQLLTDLDEADWQRELSRITLRCA